MNKNELDITRAVTNQNLTINENWVDDAYYDTNSKIFHLLMFIPSGIVSV